MSRIIAPLIALVGWFIMGVAAVGYAQHEVGIYASLALGGLWMLITGLMLAAGFEDPAFSDV